MTDCYVEPRPINAYELAEKVRNSMDYNPHEDSRIARNHRFEHEHFLRLIVETPTLDPVKHGYWIRHYDNTPLVDNLCSECRWVRLSKPDNLWNSNYCPHCGAKMDLECEEWRSGGVEE